jgi:hypothetical protein
MGPTSAKFDPEMEDKDGQNPIQTAEIFTAADARDRAETNAISPPECSRRSAEEAYQPMLGLFGSTVNGSTIGAPKTKPKEVFAWEKTKGIE